MQTACWDRVLPKKTSVVPLNPEKPYNFPMEYASYMAIGRFWQFKDHTLQQYAGPNKLERMVSNLACTSFHVRWRGLTPELFIHARRDYRRSRRCHRGSGEGDCEGGNGGGIHEDHSRGPVCGGSQSCRCLGMRSSEVM